MRKKVVYFLLSAILIVFACTNKQAASGDEVKLKKDSLLLFKLPVDKEKILGYYNGDFDGSTISIVLRFLSGKNISGYNIYKGVKRNIAGTIVYENNQLHLQLYEPGTEKFDGRFDIYLDTTTLTGKATWWPVVNKSIVKKDFILTKKNEESNYFSQFSDSLKHSIFFRPDGSCIYEYYINENSETEQKLSITGNYKISSDSLTIYWQPNTIFPNRTSFFKIFKEYNTSTEDTLRVLKGIHGIFSEIYMP